MKVENLMTKAALMFVLLFGIGSSNAFAGDINEFNNIRSAANFSFGFSYFADDLSVGESKKVTIHANEPFNYTHIHLQEGKRYKFTVASPAWNNGNIETDAGGYNSTAPYACTRRYTQYKTMALVGEIFGSDNNSLTGTGTVFLIGLGRDSYTAARNGYLVAFANDCLPCYTDNSRIVELTVKRIE